MDCVTARLLLHLRPPAGDEFGPDDLAALDRHLAGCPDCGLASARLGQWDERLAAAMPAVPVPPTLRPALLSAFDRTVYRSARRRWARRAAVAAAVLLALGGGYAGYALTRPVLDSEMVAYHQERDEEFVEAEFDSWRQVEKLPPLPVALDFRLHVFHGRERLAGEQVPVALFHRRDPGRGRQELKVYWVRTSAFRLDALRDAQTSRRSARVLGRSDDGRWVFLAVATTADLEPFLRREPLQEV